MKEKIKKYWKEIIIIILLITVIILGALLIISYHNRGHASDINYDKIVTNIEKKDSFLIYYYNSKSSNKNHKKIKKYLDKTGIRYYVYNDINVGKKEYNKDYDLYTVK